jgi:glycosyltransferase involved in cell wall biosynthesis
MLSLSKRASNKIERLAQKGMTKPLRVVWLPTPPESGCYSMDRYWRELDRLRRQIGSVEIVFSSLLSGPPPDTTVADRWSRATARYLFYPLRALFARPVDVFHVLDHSHAHVLRFLEGKGKKVVTVHDLAPLREPEQLSASQLKRFHKRMKELRRADLLLAVSNFTANEVKQFLDPDTPPIKRLLNGVDNQKFANLRCDRFSEIEKINSGHVVLCLGSNLYRKNLRILPDVIELALNHLESLTLLRVGPPLEAVIRSRLSALGPRLRLVEVTNLSEENLVAAYRRADLLFFPSTLEGFGLPVLEAMAAGTPIVASNASSIPEVGGDAALYFNPADIEAAAKVVVRVLSDGDLKADLQKRGLEQAARLDWRNHFTSLCGYYCELARGSV